MMTKGEREARFSQHTTEITGELCTTPFLYTRAGFTLALGDKFRFSMAFHYHFGPDSKGVQICDSHKTLASVQTHLALVFHRIVIDKHQKCITREQKKMYRESPTPDQQDPLCRTIARHVKIHVSLRSFPNPMSHNMAGEET